MKNPDLKVGQKVVTFLQSFDYVTGAELEHYYVRKYGFISSIECYREDHENLDGSIYTIEEYYLTVLVIRTEVDRQINFYDGYQSSNTEDQQTYNFPMDYINFRHDDCNNDFHFIPVYQFQFGHGTSLFS